MKIRINKQYMLFLLLFYTLIFNEPLTEAIPLLQYQDEFLAVLAVPLFCWNILLRRKDTHKTGAAVYLYGFAALALLSSVVFGYQSFFKAALPDLLLCVKFWLCIYTTKSLLRDFDLVGHSSKIAVHVKLLSWFFFILSIVSSALSLFPYSEQRYGLMVNRLFYKHPTSLASVCAILIILLVAVKPYTKGFLLHFGLLIVVMCSTLRAKAFGSAIFFVFVYVVAIVIRQKLSFKHMLFSVPVVIMVAWTQIEYYFVAQKSVSARAQLWVKSFEVAADHFPLGAGLATYGSNYSAIYYSPLYFEYGLNTVHGLGQNGGTFICDTFWPMILAQVGWFGLLLYILALVILTKQIYSIKKQHLYYSTSGMMLIIYLLIESMAGTAFVHPNASLFAVWLGILLTYKKGHNRVVSV